jgi:hypothetical protein
MRTETITQDILLTVMDAAGNAAVPVLLLGEPGTGKTSMVRTLAEANDLPFRAIACSTVDPTDLGGFPVPSADTNGGVRMQPRQFAIDLADAGRGLLVLDELSTATPAVQAGMLKICSERFVGEIYLPDAVRIVAAANPADQAANGFELEPPSSNRFLHLPYTPSVDDWLTGMTVGWDNVTDRLTATTTTTEARRLKALSKVTGFIRNRRTLAQAYPSDASKTGEAWPSLRTWDWLHKVLAYLPDDNSDRSLECRRVATIGLVGEAAGVEFLTWERTLDLPDPEKVIADPTSVDWQSIRNDRLYAILGAVTAYATEKAMSDPQSGAWNGALAVMGHAADANKGDVVMPFLRNLVTVRKQGNANVAIDPKVMTKLVPLIRDAGIMSDLRGN